MWRRRISHRRQKHRRSDADRRAFRIWSAEHRSSLCSDCCCASVPNNVAYLTHTDGTIAQYKVAADGKFIPLSPATVKMGEGPTKVVVTPSGQYAYAASSRSSSVWQYSVGKNGELTPLDPPNVASTHYTVDITIDSTSRFVYVTQGSKDGKVLQYKINDNGTLSPQQPLTVAAGTSTGRIAAHPTEPYVYVDSGDGRVSCYRIKSDGTFACFGTSESCAYRSLLY